MVVESFKIVLDDPSKTYKPGDKITGEVRLKVEGEEETSAIVIKLVASSLTAWTALEMTVIRVPRKKDHMGLKMFYERSAILLGTGDEESSRLDPDSIRTIIPPGKELQFRFNLDLPVNTPTFPSQTILDPGVQQGGALVWLLEAQIRTPWNKEAPLGTSASEDVTITPLPLDLNTVPGADAEVSFIKELEFADMPSFCCCCAKYGPIKLSVKIERKGWSIGEFMPVLVEIDNQSSREIIKLEAYLVLIWKLIGEYSSVGESEPVSEIGVRTLTTTFTPGMYYLEGVKSRKSAVWEFKMHVFNDHLPPSAVELEKSKSLVKFQHCIKIKLLKKALSGESNNTLGEIDVPIIVGNVPLKTVSSKTE